MADGSTKPIGEVTIGDKVKATDPTTGKTDTKPVTQLHLNRDHDLTKLTITAGAAVAVLETTQHHPFWDATTKQWIDAGALVPGQATTTSPDGVQQSVVAVENRTGSELMVNLTVADTHTYYVLAGTTPVLVHNCGDLPEGYTSSPALRGDPYHPDQVAGRHDMWVEQFGGRGPGDMIGSRGPQITSRTTWEHGPYRIDVENPSPGVRPGQMHFQDQGTGLKIQFDFELGEFTGLPSDAARRFANNRQFLGGIEQGLRYLGY